MKQNKQNITNCYMKQKIYDSQPKKKQNKKMTEIYYEYVTKRINVRLSEKVTIK